MIYQFESGTKYKGLDAQTVGSELERIRESSGGELPTERVVEEARNKDNPLHNVFTWDVKSAAHNWWNQEARQLIRCVLVRVTPDSAPVHAFIHTTVKVIDAEEQESSRPIYQACHVIAQHPDQYQAAVNESTSRLQAAQRSLKELETLAPTRKQERRITQARKHVERAREALTPVAV